MKEFTTVKPMTEDEEWEIDDVRHKSIQRKIAQERHQKENQLE
jgi:hypothetical protein